SAREAETGRQLLQHLGLRPGLGETGAAGPLPLVRGEVRRLALRDGRALNQRHDPRTDRPLLSEPRPEGSGLSGQWPSCRGRALIRRARSLPVAVRKTTGSWIASGELRGRGVIEEEICHEGF